MISFIVQQHFVATQCKFYSRWRLILALSRGRTNLNMNLFAYLIFEYMCFMYFLVGAAYPCPAASGAGTVAAELQPSNALSTTRDAATCCRCPEGSVPQGGAYQPGGDNWFDIMSYFTNTPATGTSGNSNAVGWSSGNTNTGGGTVGLNRRRRLLQSQQDS